MEDYLERFSDDEFSIREEGGATWISGLALPFYDGSPGSQYELEPGYYERIDPNCEIVGDRIEACIMHDRTRNIGMTPETLRLSRTPKGLRYDIKLDESRDSRDAKIMVTNKKLQGASVRMLPIETKVDRGAITITKLKINHVALVTTGAYKNTTAYLRWIDDDKDREMMAIYEKKLADAIDTVKKIAPQEAKNLNH